MIALVKAAGLWATTSKAGRPILEGRWGECRVLVMPNDRATGAEGEPTHLLWLGDAEHGRQPMPVQRDAGDKAGAGPEFICTGNVRAREREGRR